MEREVRVFVYERSVRDVGEGGENELFGGRNAVVLPISRASAIMERMAIIVEDIISH